MRYVVSSVCFMHEGKPNFETVSDFDGTIIAWSEDVFASLLQVAQEGNIVYVADCAEDLAKVGSIVAAEGGPKMCLIERDFFERAFNMKTRSIGDNVPHA